MCASSWRLSADKLGLKRLEERRHAFDPRGAINVGNGARQREPVLDRIAGARRRLRAIAEHPPAAVGAAPDIDRVETQMRAAGRRDADQRPQEFRIAGDQGGGQAAVARSASRARRRRRAPLRAARRAGSGPASSCCHSDGSMISGTWLSGHGRSMPAASS